MEERKSQPYLMAIDMEGTDSSRTRLMRRHVKKKLDEPCAAHMKLGKAPITLARLSAMHLYD